MCGLGGDTFVEIVVIGCLMRQGWRNKDPGKKYFNGFVQMLKTLGREI